MTVPTVRLLIDGIEKGRRRFMCVTVEKEKVFDIGVKVLWIIK